MREARLWSELHTKSDHWVVGRRVQITICQPAAHLRIHDAPVEIDVRASAVVEDRRIGIHGTAAHTTAAVAALRYRIAVLIVTIERQRGRQIADLPRHAGPADHQDFVVRIGIVVDETDVVAAEAREARF
jgi:hypothetical protein